MKVEAHFYGRGCEDNTKRKGTPSDEKNALLIVLFARKTFSYLSFRVPPGKNKARVEATNLHL